MTRKARLKMINENMIKFGPLPKDYDDFCEYSVHKENNYIFYTKCNDEAYCTGCKTHGTMKLLRNKPVHNKYNVCSCCGRNVKAKSTAYGRKTLEHVEWSLFVEVILDNVLFRYVRSIKRFDTPDNPTIENKELLRAVLDLKTKSLKWFGCYDKEWNNYRKSSSFYISIYREPIASVILYNVDLERELRDTSLKYSQINKIIDYEEVKKQSDFMYADKHKRISDALASYLQTILYYPHLEKMIKCGLLKMALDEYQSTSSRYVDVEKKKLHENLKLTKYEYKVLSSLTCPHWSHIDIIKAFRRQNKVMITNEIINDLRTLNRNYDSVIDLMQVMSYDKALIRYKEGGYKYVDYIKMAIALNYDLRNDSVVWPQDLERAHDTAVTLFNKEKAKKLKQRMLNLAKEYNFENDYYKIVIPKSSNEIVREGQKLHHCVASYVDDVAAGKTTILFVRKKEDIKTPYFTIEIKNGELIQAHGLKNCDPPEDVDQFIKDFLSYLDAINNGCKVKMQSKVVA